MAKRAMLTIGLLVSVLASSCASSAGEAGDATQPSAVAAAESDAQPTQSAAPIPTSTREPAPEFYDAPGDLEVPQPLPSEAPGSIIDTEELDVAGAIGYRIAYHSTSRAGDDIAVSGFVAYPAGEAPAGGWPLVAWAHGTTGLGDSCAPSITAEQDPVVLGLIGFGYAVVATDYEGLGTPGTHPYFVGASEAHSVLDSVRATHALDLPVSDRWIVFGHSQGGHAALFTGQLQPTYAPELDLIGVVAGAPPSQTRELNDALVGSDFQGYLVMSAAGIAAGYGLALDDILADEALDLIDVVETGCTYDIFDVFNPLDYSRVTRVEDPFSVPDWAAAIDDNDTNGHPVTMPLLIVHGGDDEQIPVDTSATLFGQLCGYPDHGPTLRLVYPGESHAGVLTNNTAVPDLLEWIKARFADEPADDACPATIDELLAADHPLNIAHAGGDQDAPHSTLFAFAGAAKAGADVLELDVLLTADDVLVVQHDLTVDKTTEATGVVLDLTFDELAALDNAYWFSPTCWPCQDRPVDEYIYRGIRTGDVPAPAGYTADDFSITTLREVARRFPNLPLDIEIKGEGDDAIAVAEALAAELTALGRLSSTVVVSFDDDVIDAFHTAAPTVAVSPGTNRLAAWLLTNTPLDEWFRLIQIPPFASGLEVATAETISRAHDEGLEVWVWPDDGTTQENAAFYEELITRGADGVIAGRPDAMQTVSAGKDG